MSRIVLTTFGSYGDVHPYIALALALARRGHAPAIATSAFYRTKVESAGIEFRAVRPDLSQLGEPADVTHRVYDRRRGAEYLVREALMPFVPQTYDDLFAATTGADLLVTHPLAYTGPLVAAKLGIPWVSTILSPMVFMSVYDPPYLPPAPWLRTVHRMSRLLYRLIFRAMKASVRGWTEPLRALARDRGLPEPQQHPMFEGQFSPHGTLALFSRLLAQPQPDWPPHTTITGFPFYDHDPVDAQTLAALDAFIAAGEPPIVFTLGSSAVYAAHDFYVTAVEIARRLGRRALLLTGAVEENQRLGALPREIFVADYAPHSRVFPRAAAIVHQGGIGTLAQAMRAGQPMLVVPFSHDQPDNAERAVKLGIAKTVMQPKFSVESGSRALTELLSDARCGQAAAGVAQLMEKERGVEKACDVVEKLLRV